MNPNSAKQTCMISLTYHLHPSNFAIGQQVFYLHLSILLNIILYKVSEFCEMMLNMGERLSEVQVEDILRTCRMISGVLICLLPR